MNSPRKFSEGCKVASLKKKTAKWCVLICMIGGLVTSTSAVASQPATKKKSRSSARLVKWNTLQAGQHKC